MRYPTFYKNTRIINSLLALGLTFVLLLASFSVSSAQNTGSYISHVRTLETEDIGPLNPVGLAYSANSRAFFVIEDRGAEQVQPSETDVIALSTFADLISLPRIAAAIHDPINIAFDNKNNRLLIYQAKSNQLLEINGSTINTSNRVSVIRHNFKGKAIQDPQGLAVDDETGYLYILDAAGPQIVRIEPDIDGNLEKAVVTEIAFRASGLSALRGIAFDPTSGHLHVLSLNNHLLYELTENGQVVTTRDLTPFGLISPQAVVFAPSGDQTDNPSQMSLYLADSGLAGTSTSMKQTDMIAYSVAISSGQILELSLLAPATLPPGTNLLPATLVNIIDTSNAAWNPSSPDPAGIDYWPLTGRLFITDSEVNEMPAYWQEKNVFQSTTSGALVSTCSTMSFTNEPTGVAINPNNNHIFITTDANDRVFEVSLGSDGVYCTADDLVSSTNLSTLYGVTDAEDVAYGDNTIFIAGGTDAEVYRIPLGANGILGGGDDGAMTHFDTLAMGFTDLEGIGYNWDNGTLFIVSTKGVERYLGETTTLGTLLRAYDLSLMGPGGNIRSDVTYAPGSQNPSIKNIYIVSRGVDNNKDPNENDGRVWEINIAGSATATATSTPTKTSTPTQTITQGPTSTSTKTSTPTSTSTQGPSPTPTNTPLPTATFTPTNTPLPTSTPTATTEAGVPLTFITNADSYVKDNVPTKNFGNRTPLWVDAGPNTEAYMRFTVSGVSGSVQSAVLRVYTESGTADGPAVYAVDNAWTETGVTWNTKPAIVSGLLDDVGAISRDTWIEYDVSAFVTGNGANSFVLLTNSSDGVSFSSREGSQAPELVVTSSSGSSPTNTPVPSTATNTLVPLTATNTPVPTATNTPVTPTNTSTAGPSPTPTNTPVPPTATNTSTYTPVPTVTNTPLPPTATFTATATTAPGVPLIFIAQADSYVRDSVPTKNFGDQTPLWVDASPITQGYLHFTVSGVSGLVQSAVLRVYAESGTVDGPAVYGVDNAWTESGITWNTRPAVISGLLDEVGAISRDTWVEYNVTVFVNGNGTYSFVLSTNNTDGVSFSSREGSQPPQLVLTIN